MAAFASRRLPSSANKPLTTTQQSSTSPDAALTSAPALPLSQASLHNASSTRLLTVADWGKHHSWPPVGGLRHLIFFAETNGFNTVIRRIGRRVLIDETAFFSWVAEQGGAK